TYQGWIMTIGLCGIPATAYVARFIIPLAPWGWRAVFVWGSLGLLFPLFAWRLEESPRWCETRGRTVEGDDILARIGRDVEREAGKLPAVDSRHVPRPAAHATLAALLTDGTWKRTTLLVLVWICQTLGFYGFNSWVPTLLTERGFSIVHSLERTSLMQIGA